MSRRPRARLRGRSVSAVCERGRRAERGTRQATRTQRSTARSVISPNAYFLTAYGEPSSAASRASWAKNGAAIAMPAKARPWRTPAVARSKSPPDRGEEKRRGDDDDREGDRHVAERPGEVVHLEVAVVPRKAPLGAERRHERDRDCRREEQPERRRQRPEVAAAVAPPRHHLRGREAADEREELHRGQAHGHRSRGPPRSRSGRRSRWQTALSACAGPRTRRATRRPPAPRSARRRS